MENFGIPAVLRCVWIPGSFLVGRLEAHMLLTPAMGGKCRQETLHDRHGAAQLLASEDGSGSDYGRCGSDWG